MVTSEAPAPVLGLSLPWGEVVDRGTRQQALGESAVSREDSAQRSFTLDVSDNMVVVLFNDLRVELADEGFAIHRDFGTAVADERVINPESHYFFFMWSTAVLPRVYRTRDAALREMLSIAETPWTQAEVDRQYCTAEMFGDVDALVRQGRDFAQSGEDPRVAVDNWHPPDDDEETPRETARVAPPVIDSGAIVEVDIIANRGLYQITSAGDATYYIDTRGDERAEMQRDPGDRPRADGWWDRRWVPLIGVTSAAPVEVAGLAVEPDDVDPLDSRNWVLRVGSRHEYCADPSGMIDGKNYRYWVQHPCEAIELVEADAQVAY